MTGLKSLVVLSLIGLSFSTFPYSWFWGEQITFYTTSWCANDMCVSIPKTKVMIVQDAMPYCNSDYGCAYLDDNTVIAQNRDVLDRILNHEIMHIYRYHEYGDFEHSDAFIGNLSIWNPINDTTRDTASFSTGSWCNPSFCYNFSVPINITIVDNLTGWCPLDGKFYFGCAHLDSMNAIVKNIEGRNLTSDIDHEVLHLWLWQTKKDAAHDATFCEYEVKTRRNRGLWSPDC